MDEKRVRTFTGAWIETRLSLQSLLRWLFAPSRVRGLKLDRERHLQLETRVRTFTGAWIETWY